MRSPSGEPGPSFAELPEGLAAEAKARFSKFTDDELLAAYTDPSYPRAIREALRNELVFRLEETDKWVAYYEQRRSLNKSLRTTANKRKEHEAQETAPPIALTNEEITELADTARRVLMEKLSGRSGEETLERQSVGDLSRFLTFLEQLPPTIPDAAASTVEKRQSRFVPRISTEPFQILGAVDAIVTVGNNEVAATFGTDQKTGKDTVLILIEEDAKLIRALQRVAPKQLKEPVRILITGQGRLSTSTDRITYPARLPENTWRKWETIVLAAQEKNTGESTSEF